MKDIIMKILVAGIGIQSSRFLVAATLDVSTIAMAAVGAFPAQLMTVNTDFSEGTKARLKEHMDSSANTINQKWGYNLFP